MSFITIYVHIMIKQYNWLVVMGRGGVEGEPSNLNRHCTVLGWFRAARWLLGHDKPIFLQLVREKVKTSMGTEFVK